MACPFCQIIDQQQPCYPVYQTADVLVILAVPPAVPGHLLVMPKHHYPDLLATPPSVLAQLQMAIQTVTRHLITHCGVSGVNLLLASGPSAGQSVPHLHWHLIPRYPDDGVTAWPQFPPVNAGDLAAEWRRLRLPE